MTTPDDPFAQPPAASTPPPYGAPAPGTPSYPAAPPYGAPSYTSTPPPYGAPLEVRKNGLGTAALVLGILSIFPLVAIFLVPPILAIVFGIIGRRRANRGEANNGGMALAGAICGAAALVIGIVSIVGIIALTTSDSFQNYRDCLDKAGSNQAAQTACETQFKHDLVGE